MTERTTDDGGGHVTEGSMARLHWAVAMLTLAVGVALALLR